MRFVGFLLIAAGTFGLLKAPQMLAVTGSGEIAALTVFDRQDGGWERGWRPAKLRLEPGMNPVRIEIAASFLPSAAPVRSIAGLALAISSKGAIILEGSFDIAMPANDALGSDPRTASFTTPQFDVAEAGEYTISVFPEENDDLEMSKVTATLRGKLAKPDDRFRLPSMGAIALGILLLAVSLLWRRRDPSQPPPRQWGRGQ